MSTPAINTTSLDVSSASHRFSVLLMPSASSRSRDKQLVSTFASLSNSKMPSFLKPSTNKSHILHASSPERSSSQLSPRKMQERSGSSTNRHQHNARGSGQQAKIVIDVVLKNKVNTPMIVGSRSVQGRQSINAVPTLTSPSKARMSKLQ
jgi:hypothetical protein